MATKHFKKSLCASGHEQVTAAACQIMAAGGNAFDAIIAAGFVSACVEPTLTSLGGGGFLLALTADAKAKVFDFFVDTPGRELPEQVEEPHFVPVTVKFPNSDQVFNTGLGSAAVPGVLAGYEHVHAQLGRMPLAEVLQPALKLAEEGFAVNAQQAYTISLLEPILKLTEASRAIYAPGGKLIQAGQVLRNPELADFLRGLAEGADDFYHGALAETIARDMQQGHGLLTAADLASYQVIEREPLRYDYRGYTLLTNPAPSFGGRLLGLSLQLLQGADLSGCEFGSRRHLSALAAAQLATSHCRNDYLKERLDSEVLQQQTEHVRSFSRGTTHISVADTEGNVASMTTSNGEGSGYLVPGTGVMLNNMMGEDDLHPDGFHTDPPGIRVASMMAPSVLLRDGQVQLVLGSGGSKRIRTALLQVISNTVDFGMSIKQAVTAPRLHWDGEHIQLEPGFAETERAVLADQASVNQWDKTNMYFGGVHALAPQQSEAAGDPRRDGSAAAV